MNIEDTLEDLRASYGRTLSEQLNALPSLEARAALLGIVLEAVLIQMQNVRGPRATAAFLRGTAERIEADAKGRIQ